MRKIERAPQPSDPLSDMIARLEYYTELNYIDPKKAAYLRFVAHAWRESGNPPGDFMALVVEADVVLQYRQQVDCGSVTND